MNRSRLFLSFMHEKAHKWKLNGFSLIEISIVLLIVGVMLGSVMKGHDLLEQANARSTAYDFARIQTAFLFYSNDYGPDILNAPEDVWKKLHSVKLIASPQPPHSKLGGQFSVITIKETPYLRLGKGKDSSQPFLTLAQVKAIQAHLSDAPDHSILLTDSQNQLLNTIPENAAADNLYTIAIRIF